MAYSFGCYEDRMECWLISVNAMGGVKIGRMDASYAGHSFLPCLALPSQT
jgi:hypothetical protein